MHDLVGRSIGNFVIRRQVGEGGMGTVYLAENPGIDTRAAVKVLRRDIPGGEELAARMQTEGRTLAQLDSEHVVRVMDFGLFPDDGAPYLVMEWLEGETLAALLAREGPLPLPRSIAILGGISDAVATAHARGIVHRDLKPDNVFLTQRGGRTDFVKVLDFGIAKLLAGAEADAYRTGTGVPIGTPAYMSPEQCQGLRQIDHRSDIYSLGVIAYELVTGRVPFRGAGFTDLLIAHTTMRPAPPSVHVPELPKAVDDAILRALAKRPEDRFESVDALIEALSGQARATFHVPATPPLPTPAARGATVPTRVDTTMSSSAGQIGVPFAAVLPPRTRGARRLAVAAGAGALLAAAMLGVRARRRPEPPRPVAARSTESRPTPVGEAVTESSHASGAALVEMIRVTIRATPPQSTVWLDGAEVTNPFDANVASDHSVHRIQATARGYRPLVRAVVFDHPQDVPLSLQKERTAAAKPPALLPASPAPSVSASLPEKLELQREFRPR